MRRAPATLSLALDGRRANLARVAIVSIALSLAIGMLFTDSIDELVAYLLIAMACAVPVAIWIQSGATGVPVLPLVSVLFFIYYGVPILRKSGGLTTFGPSEVLNGAATVSLFLFAAALTWWLLRTGRGGQQTASQTELISGSQVPRLMLLGLAFGVLYHIALYAGWLTWLGPAFGLFRSAMLTTATAACFMLGHARARGLLRGQKLLLAVTGLGAMVALSWASLFLVSGIMFCMAAMVGYVITSKRVPWGLLSAAIAVVIVLHAGKDRMREKYWFANQNSGAGISVVEVPSLMAEWVGTGLTTVISGGSYSSAIDRASLLQLLLQVQRLTPDYIAPLEGRSYAVLPQMLVPRFLDPDKVASQAAMNMLNVHFGFQTAEGTRSTAVGWGLVAEAYANFGRLGVVGVALAFGLLTGFVERRSIGAPLISLPSLIAVIVMMELVNMEGDAAGIVSTLFQSVLAITGLFWIFRTLSKKGDRRRKRSEPRGDAEFGPRSN
jgi:hypothetical protein